MNMFTFHLYIHQFLCPSIFILRSLEIITFILFLSVISYTPKGNHSDLEKIAWALSHIPRKFTLTWKKQHELNHTPHGKSLWSEKNSMNHITHTQGKSLWSGKKYMSCITLSKWKHSSLKVYLPSQRGLNLKKRICSPLRVAPFEKVFM